MAIIYKISNDINSSVYIGTTTKTVDARWGEHIRESRRQRSKNRPLYKDMNQYGISHFNVELIETCSDNVRFEREAYWISIFDSYQNGYNNTYGGKGKSECCDDGKIVSLHNQRKNVNEISNITGYCVDTCRKILRENGIQEDENRDVGLDTCRKAVIQIDKNTHEEIRRYKSMSDAYRSINKQVSSHISCACNGKRKTAYGFIWKWA